MYFITLRNGTTEPIVEIGCRKPSIDCVMYECPSTQMDRLCGGITRMMTIRPVSQIWPPALKLTRSEVYQNDRICTWEIFTDRTLYWWVMICMRAQGLTQATTRDPISSDWPVLHVTTNKHSTSASALVFYKCMYVRRNPILGLIVHRNMWSMWCME